MQRLLRIVLDALLAGSGVTPPHSTWRRGTNPGAPHFAIIAKRKLRGRCFGLPVRPKSGNTSWLYVGKADPAGEFPVFWYDADLAEPHIDLDAADFGEWVLEETSPYISNFDHIPEMVADPSRCTAHQWHQTNNLGAPTLVVEDFPAKKTR